MPTLLAAAGLEGEGYCEGWGLAYTDWSGGGQHPKSFLWVWVCGVGRECGVVVLGGRGCTLPARWFFTVLPVGPRLWVPAGPRT